MSNVNKQINDNNIQNKKGNTCLTYSVLEKLQKKSASILRDNCNIAHELESIIIITEFISSYEKEIEEKQQLLNRIKEKEKKGLSPFDNLMSFLHERETILNKQFDDLKEKDIRLSTKEKIIQKILDKKIKSIKNISSLDYYKTMNKQKSTKYYSIQDEKKYKLCLLLENLITYHRKIDSLREANKDNQNETRIIKNNKIIKTNSAQLLSKNNEPLIIKNRNRNSYHREYSMENKDNKIILSFTNKTNAEREEENIEEKDINNKKIKKDLKEKIKEEIKTQIDSNRNKEISINKIPFDRIDDISFREGPNQNDNSLIVQSKREQKEESHKNVIEEIAKALIESNTQTLESIEPQKESIQSDSRVNNIRKTRLKAYQQLFSSEKQLNNQQHNIYLEKFLNSQRNSLKGEANNQKISKDEIIDDKCNNKKIEEDFINSITEKELNCDSIKKNELQMENKESEIRKEIDEIQTYEESLYGKKDDTKELLLNDQINLQLEQNKLEENKVLNNENKEIYCSTSKEIDNRDTNQPNKEIEEELELKNEPIQKERNINILNKGKIMISQISENPNQNNEQNINKNQQVDIFEPTNEETKNSKDEQIQYNTIKSATILTKEERTKQEQSIEIINEIIDVCNVKTVQENQKNEISHTQISMISSQGNENFEQSSIQKINDYSSNEVKNKKDDSNILMSETQYNINNDDSSEHSRKTAMVSVNRPHIFNDSSSLMEIKESELCISNYRKTEMNRPREKYIIKPGRDKFDFWALFGFGKKKEKPKLIVPVIKKNLALVIKEEKIKKGNKIILNVYKKKANLIQKIYNYNKIVSLYQMIWRYYKRKEYIDTLREVSKEEKRKLEKIFDYTISEGSNIKEEQSINNINKMKEIVNETKSIEKELTEFIQGIEENP